MIDVNDVRKQAEAEIRDEKLKVAKEKVKNLLRKEDAAKSILLNIQKEIADAYATIGEGTTTQPSN